MKRKTLPFLDMIRLLNQDQGIRIVLQVVNDLCFVRADELALYDWGGDRDEEDDQKQITTSIRSLKKKGKIIAFLKKLSKRLATYDWRASSSPGLKEEERRQ